MDEQPEIISASPRNTASKRGYLRQHTFCFSRPRSSSPAESPIAEPISVPIKGLNSRRLGANVFVGRLLIGRIPTELAGGIEPNGLACVAPAAAMNATTASPGAKALNNAIVMPFGVDRSSAGTLISRASTSASSMNRSPCHTCDRIGAGRDGLIIAEGLKNHSRNVQMYTPKRTGVSPRSAMPIYHEVPV